MFDAGEAGASAAGAPGMLPSRFILPLGIRVVTLPAGQDPADLVAVDKDELLLRGVISAVPLAPPPHQPSRRVARPH